MYRPLPDELTIKNSPIEGLGLFSTKDIKANTFIGVTHIRDEQFENKYIRTPLGGFYNHSNDPTVMRMVSNMLPTLKFGDPIDTKAKAKKFDENDTNRENMYYNLSEKPDAKYMFMVSVKDIKAGEYIVYEAFKIVDPDSHTKIYNDLWLKEYTTALIKQQWGTNLVKFEGMQLPGGVILNGRQIYDDATAEIQILRDRIRSEHEFPPDFFVG